MANKSANFHETITDFRTKDGDLVWVQQGRQRRRVKYGLTPHYHPWTDELIRKLNTDGLPALLDAKWQSTLVSTLTPGFYTTGPAFTGTFPKDVIDVSDDGPVLDLQLGAVLPRPGADRGAPVARTSGSRRRSAGSTTSSTRPAPTRRSTRRSGSGSSCGSARRLLRSSSPRSSRSCRSAGDSELKTPHREGDPGVAGQAVPAARHRARTVPRLPATAW